jgi:MFS family permease
LGLIEGIADACTGVARFGGGALADDPERRRRSASGGYTATAVLSSLIGPAGRLGDRRGFTLVLSVGAAAFAGAFLGLAFGGPLLVLGLWFVAGGLGIACVETAQHAAVATNAPTAVRGSAFGLLAGIQSIGNFVASASAGVLWTVFSAEVAFIYAAACMLLALMVFARPSTLIAMGSSNADWVGLQRT